jgi:hypothetical protein
MLPVISALLALFAGLFRSRASLCLEHLALRHQLAVYQQTVHRARLRSSERVLWAWLARLWPGWRDALAFVQPCTVIGWQQQRFRDCWRRMSQQETPGRPAIAQEVRALIQAMRQANPTGGSPRIVGELCKLGIDVAKSTVETYRVRPRQPPSPISSPWSRSPGPLGMSETRHDHIEMVRLVKEEELHPHDHTHGPKEGVDPHASGFCL